MNLLSTIGRCALLAAATLSAPVGAWAQQTVRDDQTVRVEAVGRVSRAPDRAVLLLAVESFAATATAAAAENAERADALLAALRRLGLDEDAVETVSYQLFPEYDYAQPPEPRRPGEQRLIGYRAVNTIRVTIDDIVRVGEIIDAAIAAGANRVNGLSFQLRDPEAARRDALREAVAAARSEAETLASALGRRLGPELAVTTGRFTGPRPLFRTARAEMAAATPIEPGALDVEATVTVVYRLEPRP